MRNTDFAHDVYYPTEEEQFEYTLEFKPRSRKKNDLFHKYPKRKRATCTSFSFGKKYLTIKKDGKAEKIPLPLIKRFKADQVVSVNVRKFEWRESV